MSLNVQEQARSVGSWQNCLSYTNLLLLKGISPPGARSQPLHRSKGVRRRGACEPLGTFDLFLQGFSRFTTPGINLGEKDTSGAYSVKTEHTLWLVRGLLEWCLDQHLERRDLSVMDLVGGVYDALHPIDDLSELVAAEKYLLLYPIATWWHNQYPQENALPKRPIHLQTNWIFRGHLRDVIRKWSNQSTTKSGSRLNGLYQVKRACAAVPEQFIYDAAIKHRATMAREFKAPPHQSFGFDDTKDHDRAMMNRVQDMIVEMTDYLIRNRDKRWFRRNDLRATHEISSSACYENSRSFGGAYAYVSQWHEKRYSGGHHNPCEKLAQGCTGYPAKFFWAERVLTYDVNDDIGAAERHKAIRERKGPMKEEDKLKYQHPHVRAVGALVNGREMHVHAVSGAFGPPNPPPMEPAHQPNFHNMQITEFKVNPDFPFCQCVPGVLTRDGRAVCRPEMRWRDIATAALRELRHDGPRIQSEENRDAGRCRAECAFVLEPLKVRTITKGNALAYASVQAVQKMWHGLLRQEPCFALIGTPLTPAHIEDLVRKNWQPGLGYASGDYSGATDGVRSGIGLYALDVLLNTYEDRWNEIFSPRGQKWYTDMDDIVELCRSVLGPHRVEYPLIGKKKLKVEAVDQINGQLMGSVLSFPALCVTNLCTYWLARELVGGKKFTYHEIREMLLVNGDDILFLADQKLYNTWKDVLPHFGFELSLGKNYFCEKFCMINTKMFRVYQDFGWRRKTFFPYGALDGQTSSIGPTAREMPFFNVGLLIGQRKVVGHDDDVPEDSPTGVIHNYVCMNASDPQRASRRFKFYHKEQLARESCDGRYQYHFPVWLGGLGLYPWEFDGRVTPYTATDFQLRIAHRLWQHQGPGRLLLLKDVHQLGVRKDSSENDGSYGIEWEFQADTPVSLQARYEHIGGYVISCPLANRVGQTCVAKNRAWDLRPGFGRRVQYVGRLPRKFEDTIDRNDPKAESLAIWRNADALWSMGFWRVEQDLLCDDLGYSGTALGIDRIGSLEEWATSAPPPFMALPKEEDKTVEPTRLGGLEVVLDTSPKALEAKDRSGVCEELLVGGCDGIRGHWPPERSGVPSAVEGALVNRPSALPVAASPRLNLPEMTLGHAKVEIFLD